jgi:hypothetical protein
VSDKEIEMGHVDSRSASNGDGFRGALIIERWSDYSRLSSAQKQDQDDDNGLDELSTRVASRFIKDGRRPILETNVAVSLKGQRRSYPVTMHPWF